jgi:hypothetical protein
MKKVFLAVVLGLLLVLAIFVTLRPVNVVAAPAAAGGVRATLTVTQILLRPGITRTLYTADGDGHKFFNDGRTTFLEIANGYNATITATFVTPNTAGGFSISDLDIPIPAGNTRMIGPFPTNFFNQPQDVTDRDMVYLNWNSAVTGSVATSVTLSGFRLE